MAKDKMYIEKSGRWTYAVRRPMSERAIALCRTIPDAISRAREVNPDAVIYIEKFPDTNFGRRDKWIQVE